MDKNKSNKSKLDVIFEDYGVEPVPESETKNWLSMGAIWAGVGISLGMLLTGGTVGDGLNFKMAVISALIGGIVLALVTLFVGIVGANTKLSTAMISRFTFGEKAVLILALIQAFGSYGWFGVQLGLFGNTSATAIELAFNVRPSVTLLIIVGGFLMIATATKGYKALDILSKIAVPLLLVLMVGSVFKVLENNTISDIFQFTHAGEAITLGTGISMVISSFIVGAVVAPDVSRYAKTPKDTIFASILAFVIIIPLVITIGTIMAQATGTWDLVDIMLKLGWGLMALLVLLLAQWTSNDNNLYCSALGFAVVFKKLKKWQLTIISGVLGIILAIFGIYDNFIYWLLILGILIPPMGGVIIADYYFKNKTYYEIINLPRLKKLRWDSLIAWIVGSAIALITSNTSITLTTVAALDGFIIAGIVQYALCKTIYKDETPLEKNE